MQLLKGHDQPITALAFSPDSVSLTACSDNHLNLWDVATGTLNQSWGGGTYARYGLAIQFDPLGRWLLASASSEGFFAIDMQTLAEVRVCRSRATLLTVSPTGNRLVVGRWSLTGFDIKKNGVSGRKWLKVLSSTQVRGMDYFPDGKRFASVEFETNYTSPSRCYLRIRSAADGALLSEVAFGRKNCAVTRVSPDGTWIAFLSTRYLIIHHVAEPNKSIKIETPPKMRITGLAFHPSGRFLAATNNNKTVCLHDRDSDWTVTHSFDWNVGKLKSIAFSPDGNLAAVGSEKGQIVVWDVDL